MTADLKSYALRSRRDSDLDAILSWIPDPDALYRFSGPRLFWPLTRNQLRMAAQADGLTAWVLASHADPCHVLGQIELTQTDANMHVGRVIVDPACRGEGLGRLILECAVREAAGRGASTLTLNVIAGNTPAIRIYERLGFVAGPAAESDAIPMKLTLP